MLIGGIWRQRLPNWRDVAAIILVMAALGLIGTAGRQLVAPWVVAQQPAISLSPAALPMYALRTMLADAGGDARLAAVHVHLRHAGRKKPPRRNGTDSSSGCAAVGADPRLSVVHRRVLRLAVSRQCAGPELAAIFAIFTSQAWNMAFSFYQSLKTVPHDLDEASRSFRSSGWQRFWRLEVPFAMPGLIWNMMMSMSGGWFFVVASEAISVGDVQIHIAGRRLLCGARHPGSRPGGSGLGDRRDDDDDPPLRSAAISPAGRLGRQISLRADRGIITLPSSWVLDLFRRSKLLRLMGRPIGTGLHMAANTRRLPFVPAHRRGGPLFRRLARLAWYGARSHPHRLLSWDSARFAGPDIVLARCRRSCSSTAPDAASRRRVDRDRDRRLGADRRRGGTTAQADRSVCSRSRSFWPRSRRTCSFRRGVSIVRFGSTRRFGCRR